MRKLSEFQSAHVINANNTSLSNLNNHLSEYPEKETFYVYCAGGYRSMIASSILKNRGIHNLINVEGGFNAIKEAGVETSDYVCPSTLNK